MQMVLTSRAKFAESSGIAPGDGFASGPKLDTRKSRHIVTQHGLIELDGVGQQRSHQFAVGVEALDKFLEGEVDQLRYIAKFQSTDPKVNDLSGDHQGEELFRRGRQSSTNGLTDVLGDLSDTSDLLLLLILVLVSGRHC